MQHNDDSAMISYNRRPLYVSCAVSCLQLASSTNNPLPRRSHRWRTLSLGPVLVIVMGVDLESASVIFWLEHWGIILNSRPWSSSLLEGSNGRLDLLAGASLNSPALDSTKAGLKYLS